MFYTTTVRLVCIYWFDLKIKFIIWPAWQCQTRPSITPQSRTLEREKNDVRTREMPPTIAHAHRLIVTTQKPAAQRAGLTGCPCSLQGKQPVKWTVGETKPVERPMLVSDSLTSAHQYLIVRLSDFQSIREKCLSLGR